ncbi:lamin tail domain-containing protein [Candidatus Dojkabacteria bacterium]|uniref:Lamin tail domain-containing protein n=1 Tax=Candidatus Dojkabacteria bacterium TaxID=2099670 RepID=A0A955L6V4_9BACT|nr:lamin tail domain-containing protein [Candidatus Dojkabacteria bacterium]
MYKAKASSITSLLRYILPLVFFFNGTQSAFGYLVITELLPNPIGADSEGEYLEIYNPSGTAADLSDYLLDGKAITTFNADDELILEPGKFAIVHDDNFDSKSQYPGNYVRGVVSSTSFSNSGDSVVLADVYGTTYDTFSYNDSEEGKVLVRPTYKCSTVAQSISGTGSFLDHETISDYSDTIFPIEECISIQALNDNKWTYNLNLIENDTISLKFDYPNELFTIENSKWEIDSILDFLTEEITFNSNAPDTHNAQLELTYNDGIIYIHPEITIINSKRTEESEDPPPTISGSTTLRINEIFANPSNGSEWLELYNYGEEPINTENWTIRDKNSSEKNLTSTIVEPYSFLVLEDTTLPITLNNGGDQILLTDPSGNIITSVEYPEIDDDISYSFDTELYSFTTIQTKGTENIISAPKDDDSDQDQDQNEDENNEAITSSNIKDAKEYDIGTYLKISGVVLVEPNLLGKDIFYIQDETAGIKAKLMSSISFNAEVGEKLELLGELRESVNEKYLYVSDTTDIKILTHTNPVLSKELYGEDLEPYEGSFIHSQGVITEYTGSSFIITTDHGLQMKISIQSGTSISMPEKPKGSTVRIKGILSQYKTSATTGEGYRILPRYQSDIEVLEINNNESIESSTIDKTITTPLDTIEEENVKTPTNQTPKILEDHPQVKQTFAYVKIPDDKKLEDTDARNTTEKTQFSLHVGLMFASVMGIWELPAGKLFLYNFAKDLKMILWAK